MYKKIYFLFVVLSLASCVPISDTKKSKLKFKPKAKTESIKEDETNNTETTSQGQLPSIIKLTQLEYQSAVKKILDANCLSCHGDGKSFQEFANLAPSISEIEKDIKLVIPRDLNKSVLYQKVAFGSMKAYLGDSKDADIFKDWIQSPQKV